jgi:hypothetical protein
VTKETEGTKGTEAAAPRKWFERAADFLAEKEAERIPPKRRGPR